MKDIETLYEERKNLNQKLIELDNEINNCKIADNLLAIYPYHALIY